jgi:hypothetical protein
LIFQGRTCSYQNWLCMIILFYHLRSTTICTWKEKFILKKNHKRIKYYMGILLFFWHVFISSFRVVVIDFLNVPLMGIYYLYLTGRKSVFSEVRVTRTLVFCVKFCRSLFVLLAIVLSVLLQFMVYHYSFGIFKLFLFKNISMFTPNSNSSSVL